MCKGTKMEKHSSMKGLGRTFNDQVMYLSVCNGSTEANGGVRLALYLCKTKVSGDMWCLLLQLDWLASPRHSSVPTPQHCGYKCVLLCPDFFF